MTKSEEKAVKSAITAAFNLSHKAMIESIKNDLLWVGEHLLDNFKALSIEGSQFAITVEKAEQAVLNRDVQTLYFGFLRPNAPELIKNPKLHNLYWPAIDSAACLLDATKGVWRNVQTMEDRSRMLGFSTMSLQEATKGMQDACVQSKHQAKTNQHAQR